MRFYIPFLLPCLLSGCNPQKEPSSLPIRTESPLHDLDISAQIIIHLIEKQALSTVLEQSDPQAINRLVKNFSPAEMALEAEALNWPHPVILFCIQKESLSYPVMHNTIEQAAAAHEAHIKFIEIDAHELFKVIEQFNFDRLPALILMYQRAEVARAEGLQIENFKVELQRLIDTQVS